MKIIFNYLLYLLLLTFIYGNDSNINKEYINSNNKFNLYIDKINLDVPIYEFNDENNNVNKGIYLAKDYNFDTLNGSLVLASHSGNSRISYFKNLNNLNKNDYVRIEKNSKYYVYRITNKYRINKNGKFKYGNKNKYIYLITCDKKDKKKQIVLEGKLVNISKKSKFL